MSENITDVTIIQDDVIKVDNVKRQMDMVKELYKEVMIKDEHFGKIPGTKKDTLFKAGAEKLTNMFSLVPKVEDEQLREYENNHREHIIKIGLYHRRTEAFWGHGVGSCSTMESKYKYRNEYEKLDRVPSEWWDNKDNRKTHKFEDGWYFVNITKIENSDIADVYNTVLKMAYKRALVSATITATGVSDIFTQDVEDMDKGNNGKPDEKKANMNACPKCGIEAIIISKPEYGGGFVCWDKKGGCGTKFDSKMVELKPSEKEKPVEKPKGDIEKLKSSISHANTNEELEKISAMAGTRTWLKDETELYVELIVIRRKEIAEEGMQ